MFCPSKMNGLLKQNTTVGCTPGVSPYISLLNYIKKLSQIKRCVVTLVNISLTWNESKLNLNFLIEDKDFVNCNHYV